MPILKPTSPEECRSTISKFRNEILQGDYDIAITSIEGFDEGTLAFLGQYCPSSCYLIMGNPTVSAETRIFALDTIYSNKNLLGKYFNTSLSSICSRMDTPKKLIEAIARKTNDIECVELILKNPNIHNMESTIEYFANIVNGYWTYKGSHIDEGNPFYIIPMRVAECGATPEYVLDILLNKYYSTHSYERLMESLAKHNNISIRALIELSKYKTPKVRENVAKNPKTPQNTLELLRIDENEDVRIGAMTSLNREDDLKTVKSITDKREAIYKEYLDGVAKRQRQRENKVDGERIQFIIRHIIRLSLSGGTIGIIIGVLRGLHASLADNQDFMSSFLPPVLLLSFIGGLIGLLFGLSSKS